MMIGTNKKICAGIGFTAFTVWAALQEAVPVLAAQEAEATAVPESLGGGIPWTPVIIVSSIISLVIATILAVRKANKVYGKGFD